MSDVNLSLGFKDAAKSLDIVAKALGVVSKEFLETYTNGIAAMQAIAKNMTTTKGGNFIPQLQGTISLISKMESSISNAAVGQKKWVSVNELSSVSLEEMRKKLADFTADFKKNQALLAASEKKGAVKLSSSKIDSLKDKYAKAAEGVAKYSAAIAANMEIQNLFTEKQLKSAVIAQVFTKRLQELGAATKISPQRFINDLQLLNQALIDGGISSKDYVIQLKEFSKAGGLSENFNLLANTIAGVNNAFKKGVILPKEYKDVMSSLLNLMGTKAITSSKQMAEALKILDGAFENDVNAAGKFYNILQRMVTAKLKKGESVEALKMIGGYLEKNRLSAGAFSAQLKRIVPQLQKMKPPKVGTKEFNVFLSTLKSVVLQVEKFNRVSSQKINTLGLNNMISGMEKFKQKTVQAKTHVVSLSRALGTVGEKIYVLAQFYVIRRMLFAVSDLARESVRLGVVLETTFINIGAIMKLTNSQIAEAKQQVKELGQATGISIEELGKAFTQIARSGLSFADSMKAVKQSAILAKATMGTMDEGVSAVLTTIKSFNEEAGQNLPLAIDTITSAINNSRLDLKGFNQAFQYVASIAGSAHIKLKEVTAALGTLADSGLTAAKAGVYLRSTMAEFLRSGAKLKTMVGELGLSMKDVALRNTHSLIKSLTALHEGISASNASFAAFGVMSKRTAQGLAILLGHYAKLMQLFKMPVKSEAMITLQYQMQSFQASWEVSINKMRDAFLKIFDSLRPVLLTATSLIDEFAKLSAATGGYALKLVALVAEGVIVVKMLTAMKKVFMFLASMKYVGTFIAALATKFSVLTTMAQATTVAVEETTVAIEEAGAASTVALGGVGKIISLVVVGLTALYFMLHKNSQAIKDIGKNLDIVNAKIDNFQRVLDKLAKARKALSTGNASDILSVKDMQEISKALGVSVKAIFEYSDSVEQAYAEVKKLTEAKMALLKIEQMEAEKKYTAAAVDEITEKYKKLKSQLEDLNKVWVSDPTSGYGTSVTKLMKDWTINDIERAKAVDILITAEERLKVVQRSSLDGQQKEQLIKQLQSIITWSKKLVKVSDETIGQLPKVVDLFKELGNSAKGAASDLRAIAKVAGIPLKDNAGLKEIEKTLAKSKESNSVLLYILDQVRDKGVKVSKDTVKAINDIINILNTSTDAFTEWGKIAEKAGEKFKAKELERQITVATNFAGVMTSLSQKQVNFIQQSGGALSKIYEDMGAHIQTYNESLAENAKNLDGYNKLQLAQKLAGKLTTDLLKENVKLRHDIASIEQTILQISQKKLQAQKDENNFTLISLKARGNLMGIALKDNTVYKNQLSDMADQAERLAKSAMSQKNYGEAVKQYKESIRLQNEIAQNTEKGSNEWRLAQAAIMDAADKAHNASSLLTKKLSSQQKELEKVKQDYVKKLESNAKQIEDLSNAENSAEKLNDLFRDLQNNVLPKSLKYFTDIFKVVDKTATKAAEVKKVYDATGKLISVTNTNSATGPVGNSFVNVSQDEMKRTKAIVDAMKATSTGIKSDIDTAIKTMKDAFPKRAMEGMIDGLENFKTSIKDTKKAEIPVAVDQDTFLNSLKKGEPYKVKVEAEQYSPQGKVRNLGFSSGGHLSGFGGGDTIPAFLERGEFVLRKEAVRKYGLSFFETLNKMRLPSIKIPKFSTGGVVNPTSMGTLVFEVGGNSYPVNGGPGVLQALKLELSNIMRRK